MKAYIKNGILAGLVLFLWGAFSWMVLPWHRATIHNFIDGQAVAAGVSANVIHSGIYLTPMGMGSLPEQTKQAMVFASVHLSGMPSMVPTLIISILTQLIAAILVSYLLSKTKDLTFYKRLKFVLVFALAAGIVIHVPYWNWFGFDITYTLVEMADLLIGWLLAGLVLAKLRTQ